MVFWFNESTVVVNNMMEFSGKNSSENLYNSLILSHAARLMTRLIGVWPAVDLSWKALVYIYFQPLQALLPLLPYF